MVQFLQRLAAGIHWMRLAVVALVLLALNLILRAYGVDGDVLAYANTLVTPSWIMKEGMFRLTNQMKFTGEVNRS